VNISCTVAIDGLQRVLGAKWLLTTVLAVALRSGNNLFVGMDLRTVRRLASVFSALPRFTQHSIVEGLGLDGLRSENGANRAGPATPGLSVDWSRSEATQAAHFGRV
jgi:hypothetical protein